METSNSTIDTDTSSFLVGKLFRAGGARRGFWLVISMNPKNTGCVCLGLDEEFNIVSAANYQKYYVEQKETVAMVDINDVCLKT